MEIKKDIITLLTEPATFHNIVSDDDDGNKNTFKNIQEIVDEAIIRESSELTDQLWEVLKGCSSYEMLKEAIEYVFTSAAKINVVVGILIDFIFHSGNDFIPFFNRICRQVKVVLAI